jgi:glycine cleavage system H protein
VKSPEPPGIDISSEMPEPLHYQRARFALDLPVAYRYSTNHFWLACVKDGVWRVGLTKFGTRMLGEIVDLSFNVAPGGPVIPGQVIGSIEGFKAICDLCCLGNGQFVAANPALASEIGLINRDPHGEGWLYSVQGEPDPNCVSAQGYMKILDEAIEDLLGGMGTACGT